MEGQDMKLAVLKTGDVVHRYKRAIVVPFCGKRRVLSTSPSNGGYREDIDAVFNFDGTTGAGIAYTLKAPTYAEHMNVVAEEIGLDSSRAVGISTAAQMENVAIRSESWRDLTVTAVVTGGIEVNGGRVGDAVSWEEADELAAQPGCGTINILLFFSVDLTEGALTRALVTCTEAKTAALQELASSSRYSMGLATGSGTDGTILVANMESPVCLTNAGKHTKVGELIGRAVKEALKEALKLQTGLCPKRQHQVARRMDRFGITHDGIWENYTGALCRADFEACLEDLLQRDRLVTYTSLYAHLLDQMMWGLLSVAEVTEAAAELRALMGMEKRGDADAAFELKEPLPLPAGCAVEQSRILELVRSYGAGLLDLVREEEKKRGLPDPVGDGEKK